MKLPKVNLTAAVEMLQELEEITGPLGIAGIADLEEFGAKYYDFCESYRLWAVNTDYED